METSENGGTIRDGTEPDTNAHNLPASGVTPSPALLLDTAITKVDAVATAHDTLAARVSEIEDTVSRISDLAAQLSGTHPVAGLVQEVVDWLHKFFPGHNVPGAPSA